MPDKQDGKRRGWGRWTLIVTALLLLYPLSFGPVAWLSYRIDASGNLLVQDADANTFEKSQSSYSDYGNAAVGPICDASGKVIGHERRRPKDTATVTTDRYRYRYDGRWLMTDVRISPDRGKTYGPDLVDRWKARAFQRSTRSGP